MTADSTAYSRESPRRSQMKRFLKSAAALSASIAALYLCWFWLLPNNQKPRTVGQSVQYLLEKIPEDDLKLIAATPTKEGLVEFHFSYGMFIRNELGLWDGNLRLLLSIGEKEALHPDIASHFVLVALWENLNETEAANTGRLATASPSPAP